MDHTIAQDRQTLTSFADDLFAALNQAQAEVDLHNRAFYPLQKLKTKVAALNSIPRILYLKEQAGNLLDEAMDLIASAQKPEPAGINEKKPGGSVDPVPGAGTQPIAPTVVVRASEYIIKTYLENESDIEAYLVKLREKLSATFRDGKRVRIQ